MTSAEKEYREEDLPTYTPLNLTLQEIRDAIPPELFVKRPLFGLSILARDISIIITLWCAATYIDPVFKSAAVAEILTSSGATVARWTAWCFYWWFQGLAFTGLWVFGHECGHGALSDNKYLNDTVGYLLHTFTWTPYFSFKISHHRHHSHHNHVERDQVYVPRSRAELDLPNEKSGFLINYAEFFSDSPPVVLFELIVQQIVAWPAYLCMFILIVILCVLTTDIAYNVTGQRSYPKGTSHFNPNSVIFTEEQRWQVVLSDIGIGTVLYATWLAIKQYSFTSVFNYYLVPIFAVSQWFILISYLHHTAPYMPHFRGKEWTFPRGATGTVDRDFLGWQGVFFLHNMGHHHVVHHFFPKMPFYNGTEATKYLKEKIGPHYYKSEKYVIPELYEVFSKCKFIENDGGVVFFRDRKGHAVIRPADEYWVRPDGVASK
ncbi:linoleoyl phosphatidylcholine delta-12 acetylenase [Fistulina hepatica ATCC 64428]|uniref:Linoleoyl phosphatidylcholine delta-12 acetylenase n=1 Tax=Fistulina hepatica ATCC 64428 TaxID=1128425 RepID=A0A0D7AE03_9AGAR|nr:linoleoyl phosphatidylcholine delta-12 acetylenase [Fistulina hepatica ATCC 64428]